MRGTSFDPKQVEKLLQEERDAFRKLAGQALLHVKHAAEGVTCVASVAPDEFVAFSQAVFAKGIAGNFEAKTAEAVIALIRKVRTSENRRIDSRGWSYPAYTEAWKLGIKTYCLCPNPGGKQEVLAEWDRSLEYDKSTVLAQLRASQVTSDPEWITGGVWALLEKSPDREVVGQICNTFVSLGEQKDLARLRAIYDAMPAGHEMKKDIAQCCNRLNNRLNNGPSTPFTP